MKAGLNVLLADREPQLERSPFAWTLGNHDLDHSRLAVKDPQAIGTPSSSFEPDDVRRAQKPFVEDPQARRSLAGTKGLVERHALDPSAVAQRERLRFASGLQAEGGRAAAQDLRAG